MSLRCRARTIWGRFTGQVDYLRTRIDDYDGTWHKDMNIDQLRRALQLAMMNYRMKEPRGYAPEKRRLSPIHSKSKAVR